MKAGLQLDAWWKELLNSFNIIVSVESGGVRRLRHN